MYNPRFIYKEALPDSVVCFDEIIEISKALAREYNLAAELRLKQLELKVKQENFNTIQIFAEKNSEKLIENAFSIQITDQWSACYIRYIIVPVLYKLGVSQTAAAQNQKCFAYLFPILDNMINQKITELFGSGLGSIQEKIKAIFMLENDDSDSMRLSYRIQKSRQSTWQKVPSVAEFMACNIEQFCSMIDDFVAFRCSIEPKKNENRFDAIINGVRRLPTMGIYKLRNQQLSQECGFSAEPVIKAYYIIDNIPVEIQILGGDIEWYMSAKGYADYKTGLKLPPISDSLDKKSIDSRLGYCIFLQASNQVEKFRQLMLDELLMRPVIYETKYRYLLEEKPESTHNTNYIIDGQTEPVYLQANINFCNRSDLIQQEQISKSHNKI